jgi:hypothetical protein
MPADWDIQPDMQPGNGQERAEQRRAPRVDVTGLDRLAQRTHLIAMGEDGQRRAHRCRIVEASEAGYRVVLISALQTAGLHFGLGDELRLEHIDGWQREVQVRWVRRNMMGLLILRSITRLVMPDGTLHDCVILSSNGILYRIAPLALAGLEGAFELELANGLRRRVRVRWRLGEEICLQEIETRARL